MTIPTKNRNSAITALILTISAPVLWSTGGVCIRLINLSPWTILFYRSLLMAATIIVWIIVRGNFSKINHILKNLKSGISVSIFTCIALCFYVLSMKNTGIADSLLIQGTAPLFIIIIGRFYLKDSISRKTRVALAVIVIGFMFIFIPALSSSKLNGNIFGIIKAAAFALNVIAIRKLKDVDKLPATALAAVMSCCIAAIFADSFTLTLSDGIMLLYFGVIQTGVAFILFATWSGKISSTNTAVIVLLESVLGPIWVWIYFNEVPPLTTILGGSIIIAALVYNSRQKMLPRKN